MNGAENWFMFLSYNSEIEHSCESEAIES